MAYDEQLAQHIHAALSSDQAITEKKVFGENACLNHRLMFVGVSKSSIMVPVGKANYADFLDREYVREMDFIMSKPMQCYGFVDAASVGLEVDSQLSFWLPRCKKFVEMSPQKVSK